MSSQWFTRCCEGYHVGDVSTRELPRGRAVEGEGGSGLGRSRAEPGATLVRGAQVLRLLEVVARSEPPPLVARVI